MKLKILILLIAACTFFSCNQKSFNDGYIKYEQVQLSPDDKKHLAELLKFLHELYDQDEKMISIYKDRWYQYCDNQTGFFHETRFSFSYAVALLDLGDEQYTQRAFDVVERTILLQDQDPNSNTCGVWPYFLEEPLATKQSPADLNWADFCAMNLLDIWMGHQKKIPNKLKSKIKNSLILAANFIRKRNCGPGYTNISLFGTYVTYMVSHLFDLPDMKEYANNRLKDFYNYTLDKGGFSEYNSPTYTIAALQALQRMKMHIVEPSAKQMIDSLYYIGWDRVARHYHKPTGQWSGPHSRASSPLVSPPFYSILKESSNGQIDVGKVDKVTDIYMYLILLIDYDKKIKHQIPESLLDYFISPEYPRTESDVFENIEPQITGTTYMTEKYSLATANRSSFWNQRHSFIMYWGNVQNPKYMQLRFLHDFYDFSSANIYSQQEENNILAAINFVTGSGDKHVSIDKLTDGKFKAKDLRLRFEFTRAISPEALSIPASIYKPISFKLDNLQFKLQVYHAEFDNLNMHWEKGGNEEASWIDFVIYSGKEMEFDLTKLKRAVLGLTFSVGTSEDKLVSEQSIISEKNGLMNVKWNGLSLEVATKPSPLPPNIRIPDSESNGYYPQ